MINWRIGLSTGCFYDQSIFDCLPLIRESGFDTIEVCSSPSHLDFHNTDAVTRAAERIKELHLEAYSFHAPFAANIDIASTDPEQRRASIKEILFAADAAALLDVHYFVIHPGPENPASIRAEEQLSRIQHVIDSLDQIAKRCRELGITCVLENKLPHLVFGNASELLWILDGLKGLEVGACLDTGHAFLTGDYITDLIQKLRGRLKMIHAHDNSGATDEHLHPGGGAIDWLKLLGCLVQIEFHGALILELAGAGDASRTLANARRGRAFLRATARQLSIQRLRIRIEPTGDMS